MTPKEKTLEMHRILNEVYVELPAEARRDNMRELISTILSHRTSHANEERAYSRMREELGSWKDIHYADTEALAETLSGVQWPYQKAERIQQVLGIIHEKAGDYSIEFLAEMDTDEAMEWLQSLPGVGLKTASLVALFNFQKPVLPVDTHVSRIAQRVGIIEKGTSAEKAHQQLLEYLPKDAKTLLNFHKHVYWHGQQVCTWRSPKHAQCPLQHFCDYFQQEDEAVKKKARAKREELMERLRKSGNEKVRGVH